MTQPKEAEPKEAEPKEATGAGGWIAEALREHDEHSGRDTSHRRDLPMADREQQVLDRIDRARRRRPKVREERITMSHGAGGKATHTLIEAVFLDAFRNPLLEPLEDAARLHVNGSRIALTTDSYVVSPEGACAAYYNFGRMNRNRVAEAAQVSRS
ncbi:MAG TPA: hypothetical protein VGH27_12565 [Streptosporangiaceae bacterium]